MKRSTMLYLFVTMAILFSIPSAYAAAPPYFLNGTINRSDTMAGLSGVALALNGTNTTTTDANGVFSLGVQNGSYTISVTVPNNGYNSEVNMTGTINAASNTTMKRNVTLVTPAVSSITETSITRTGGTVAWTSSISFVGNRLKYSKDSSLTNNVLTTAWSNTTASPSFTLAGLDIFTKYYYQVETYNDNNQTYSATSTGDFTTLAGNPEEEPEAYELVQQPSTGQIGSPGAIMSNVQGQVKSSKTNKVIAFGIIIVVLYLVLGGKAGGKKRR